MNWKNKNFKWFTLFALFIFILNLLFNLINGRFCLSDFNVYYSAACNMISGSHVYNLAFGDASGFYKYSPISLFFFFPYTLFSYSIAGILHYIVLCLAFWYTFIMIRKILRDYFFPEYSGKTDGLLILSMIFILLYLVKELYLGNINILLLLLCLLALQKLLNGKPIPAGIILGVVVLTKPFFLILILPLLLRRKMKTMYAFIITLISGFVIPFIFLGLHRGLFLHQEWLGTMLLHSQAYPGVNDLYYIFRYYFSPDLPAYVGYLIIIIAGIMSSWFIIMNRRMEKKAVQIPFLWEKNFIFEWFLLLGILPDIVSTDSEHFLASAPLITFIIFFIARFKYYRVIPFLILLFFFFGGNSNDLLGTKLSHQLYIMGLLGLSNLALIFLSVFLFLSYRSTCIRLSKSSFEALSLSALP